MCHREIEHTQVVFVPEVKCTRKLEQASSGTFLGDKPRVQRNFDTLKMRLACPNGTLVVIALY